jgi:large subunit ribosomal protein L23
MAFNLFHKSKKPKHKPEEAVVQESPAQNVAAVSMAPASAGSVLKRYFVSEKSSRGFSISQYTFEVDRRATKTQIRDAVERGYHVDVESVNTVRLPVKKITLGRYKGTKGGIKKAIVTLKKGQSIAQAQP